MPAKNVIPADRVTILFLVMLVAAAGNTAMQSALPAIASQLDIGDGAVFGIRGKESCEAAWVISKIAVDACGFFDELVVDEEVSAEVWPLSDAPAPEATAPPDEPAAEAAPPSLEPAAEAAPRTLEAPKMVQPQRPPDDPGLPEDFDTPRGRSLPAEG